MTLRSVRPVVLILLAALTFGGCLVGPDYQAPPTVVDDGFAGAATELVTQETAAEETASSWSVYDAAAPEAAWWQRLDDPLLTELVERARHANPDLRAAAANVRAAAELLRIERLGLRSRSSVDASVEQSESSSVNLPPGIERETTNYRASFGASWEIDLFGRIRRGIEAQAAEYEATLADRRGAFVAIAGEIARTYLELRGTQSRLAVARTNVGNQERSLELVDALLEAGRGTALESAQARAQLATTRATIPQLQALEEAAIHRLSVLVGEPPRALAGRLEAPRTEIAAVDAEGPDGGEFPVPRLPSFVPSVPERLAVGDPAALLRRRPDVAAAERRLAASTARIGIAVANLFPQVSLAGSFGYFATSLEDLGTSEARTTSIGPFLRWAAFDLRGVRARIRANEATADAELAVYERTVLTALEEAETALVSLDRARRRQAYLLAAEASAREAAELARERYRAGLESFLVVLDAESRLLTAQDALADSATATAAAYVGLYTALGGGWEGEEIGVPAADAR